MDLVAVGIAEVALEVTDEGIMPIDDVERAVGPDIGVDGAEIFVGRLDDVGLADAFDAGAVIGEFHAVDALEADAVRVEIISPIFFGEMGAGDDRAAGAGARGAVPDGFQAGVFAGVVEFAGERGGEVGVVAGGVGDDIVAPIVEGAAVGIGEAVGDVGLEAAGEGFVTVEGAVDVAHGAERGLDLRAVENAVAENDRAARFIDEGVGGVVGVGGVETHEDAFTRISFAVTVGVADEPEIGGLHDEDAVFEKLETGGAIQAVEEGGAFVGFAVAVGVLEDNELVLDGGGGGELGVPGPDGDPEAALGVPGELEGFGEFGEFLLAGEDVGFEPGREGHELDGVGGIFEDVGAIGVGAGLVGAEGRHHRDRDEVDGAGLAGGEGPGLALVIGGDRIALRHLLHHDLSIGDFGLILNGLVGDLGAVAVDVVTVDGAVVGVPPRVFLGDERAEFLGGGRVEGGGGFVEEGLEDFGGEQGVAGLAEMNAVDGEGAAGAGGFGGEFLRRSEEIDEGHAGLVAGDLGHGGGVEGEVTVVRGGHGEFGARELLVGDGGEEDDAGWRDAVVGF